jgi:hypothetical protein
MPANHAAEVPAVMKQTLERPTNTYEIEIFKCSEDSYGYVFYVLQRT